MLLQQCVLITDYLNNNRNETARALTTTIGNHKADLTLKENTSIVVTSTATIYLSTYKDITALQQAPIQSLQNLMQPNKGL